MESESSFEVPRALVAAIRSGRCIAFVGAGFVQPALPSWPELLRLLSEDIDDGETKRQIDPWLENARSNRDYEGLAECIKAALGARFEPTLASILNVQLGAETQRRLDFLDEVPFHAVLTTNFDRLIEGDMPSPATYARVLTAPRHAWWDDYYWKSGNGSPPLRVQLHGHFENAKSLVFSTRDYRKRLYEDPSYRAFLRALFATHTVLYMGFSFTDAYVNELRSEVLAMLGLDAGHGRGRDYAIMNDVPRIATRHFADNEGLEILEYSTRVGDSDKRDFSGFDRWLEAILNQAGPQRTLQELVGGKRILWLDPNFGNNAHGFEVLTAEAELTRVTSPADAIAELRAANTGPHRDRASGRYDLVISHFGWVDDAAPSSCEQLLRGMHGDDLRAPVLVFAGPEHRAENRRTALELGALAYTDSWEELFQTLEDLMLDAADRNRRR